jgi:hypothetical protein
MNRRISEMKKGYIALLAFGVVMLSAFSAAMVTSQIQRIAPFQISSAPWDSLTGGQVGGRIVQTINGDSDTLYVGDVVYWSDSNEVSKSATLANYTTIAGVVVGGAITGVNFGHITSTDVGTRAAATGQRVYLMKQGRMWMQSSNNAAWISGRRVLPSDSIAGRLDTALTAAVIDTFYRTIGRTVGAASALGVVAVEVNIK